MIDPILAQWRLYRQLLDDCLAALPAEALTRTPPGAVNHALWLYGHTIRSSDKLVLDLSAAARAFPTEIDTLFAKGSSPRDWPAAGGVESGLYRFGITAEEGRHELLAIGKECAAAIERLFADDATLTAHQPLPQSYPTSTGITLTTSGEALLYAFSHEVYHLAELRFLQKMSANANSNSAAEYESKRA